MRLIATVLFLVILVQLFGCQAPRQTIVVIAEAHHGVHTAYKPLTSLESQGSSGAVIRAEYHLQIQ